MGNEAGQKCGPAGKGMGGYGSIRKLQGVYRKRRANPKEQGSGWETGFICIAPPMLGREKPPWAS